MQKYLLTMAAAALAVGSMMAADVTLSAGAATDIVGTLVPESQNGDNVTAEHYQPVTSFKIGDFSFTFVAGEDAAASQAPALYHKNATPTIRLYKSSEMTIAFPEGVEVGSITWNLSNGKGVDNITVSTGEASCEIANKKIVWNNTDKASSVTFTLPAAKGSDGNNPNIQIASFTVSAEGATILPPEPPVGGDDLYNGLNGSSDWTLENVTLPEDLTYVWSWDAQYNCLKASAYANSQSYASESWAISPVIDLAEAEAPVVTFQHAVGPKNMSDEQKNYFQENCGFYVREEAGEWVKLNVTNWPVDWTFVSAGDLDIAEYAGKKIQLGAKYMSTDAISVTWEIKEVAVKDANHSGVAIVADENAPAVYFDLNGRRVAEPANGLFIKVQGNKATKVIFK